MKPLPALKILNELAMNDLRRRYPDIPEGYLPRPKFTDKTANGLTRTIIKFLQLSGHQAERISCTGRLVDNRKVYTDCLGHYRQIGSLKRIKSSMQPGTADISSIIFGRSVKIEVKTGRDRQRPEQAEYQRQVEAAGGIYFIASTFDQFYTWYNETFRH